jgi:hypothetical protein
MLYATSYCGQPHRLDLIDVSVAVLAGRGLSSSGLLAGRLAPVQGFLEFLFVFIPCGGWDGRGSCRLVPYDHRGRVRLDDQILDHPACLIGGSFRGRLIRIPPFQGEFIDLAYSGADSPEPETSPAGTGVPS